MSNLHQALEAWAVNLEHESNTYPATFMQVASHRTAIKVRDLLAAHPPTSNRPPRT